MNNQTKHVVIIGGGMAGLAAAASLAEKGIRLTLLDAASQMGGRARSVAIESNSQVYQLDNGQHILSGAYHETLKLLARIGMQEKDALMRIPLHLQMRNGRQTAFKLAVLNYLPAPLNQLIGLIFCKGLPIDARIAAIKFMLSLKKSRFQLAADIPLLDFLRSRQQSDLAIELLWEPLCLAALNTPIALASSHVFLNVLHDTFNQQKANSDLLLPKLHLSQLFSQPILRYLNAHHSAIFHHQRVKRIKPTDNGYHIHTKEQTFEATHVILAVSPVRLRNVVGDLPKLNLIAEQTESYQYQPIYTIYLQYPNKATISAPMLGLSGTLSQWVFDRGVLCQQSGLMAVIISTEGKHQKLTQDALALKVAQELQSAFPQLEKPLWHKVIAEKRATFSCKANLPRPANVTPYPKLYLAGDYTFADYPATIEGAVRSGVACANLVANS